MGRILRIIWMIIVPIVVVGGIYYLFTTQTQGAVFQSDDYMIAFAVIWGICFVLNLPMTIAIYIEDGDDSDKNIMAYFIWAVLLAPIWLIWQWILALIYLRNY